MRAACCLGLTLLRWIEALPDELVRARPSLCICHAWALLSGRSHDTVESRLQDVEESGDSVSAQATLLRAQVAVFQSHRARAVELARQASEQLSEGDLFLRSPAAWRVAVSRQATGDLATSIRTLEEVIQTCQEAGNVMIAVGAQSHLAKLHVRQGRLHEAREHYGRALEWAVAGKRGPFCHAPGPL